ncbi:L-type lectin-domain containing receptor kinase IX.1-like [Cryptomeria japonica]|uniref:L-type lectin-domain containing receptor kinase IX.1-like n=1 Tax=Cryptomeria japonica TaxID=3369 RepID=UPI0027DA5611|nr:L-type lectin-domain containing receptor kinase IX.1-like [Cryptomeria japonica]
MGVTFMIYLTTNQESGSQTHRYSWAVYSKSIPLWDSSSHALANFNTHFQFIIDINNDYTDTNGDGLALFLSPFELEEPEYAYGRYLGLFNGTTYNGSFYQMVAVEFDTFNNEWDPDDNHVEMDANDVFSEYNISLGHPSVSDCCS